MSIIDSLLLTAVLLSFLFSFLHKINKDIFYSQLQSNLQINVHTVIDFAVSIETMHRLNQRLLRVIYFQVEYPLLVLILVTGSSNYNFQVEYLLLEGRILLTGSSNYC